MKKKLLILLLALTFCLTACSGGETTDETDTTTPPVEETETEETQEPEVPAVEPVINEDGIQVAFDGTPTTPDAPLRAYSMMFTWTLDNYYAVAPDAAINITNNGTDEDAYITVRLLPYIRSTESFISVGNHDGEFVEMDMLGQFWGNEDEPLALCWQPTTDLPAGDLLYWAPEIYGQEDQIESVHVLPGESISFTLPEYEQDAVYQIFFRYENAAGDTDLPVQSFWITADDVTGA